MSYNTKNHLEQGGEKWVIAGTLEIKEGATVTGLAADPLLAATESALGGVKAAAKEITDTVPAKIGEDGILYVPTYPEEVEVPVAEHQADSVAEDVATLVTDFNALLAKLIAAGLMAAE
jgi:hypothetical protein